MKDLFTKINNTNEKQLKPYYKKSNLVGTADSRRTRTFSKGSSPKMSYKLYKINESINDTKPSYGIDNSPERDNEDLL